MLYAETRGPTSTATAPHLVLLHGWGLNGAVWASAIERLAERFTLTIIDLPGHGQSQHMPFESLDVVAEQVAQRVSHLPRFHLLGFSLGGMVAQHMLTRPQAAPVAACVAACVDRLVLLSTTPKFIASDDWPCGVKSSVLQAFADRLQLNHQKTMMEFLILQALGSPDAKQQIARLRETLPQRGGLHASVLTAGIELLAQADLRVQAANITRPTLIMTGERDTLTPTAASQWLADQIPQSSLLRFQDGAHALFLSHPQAFCDALFGFLTP
jgi:pimeloyl-[acyl-carrier protein] methyl ester esterase